MKGKEAKAKAAKKAALKGTRSHAQRKVRTSVSFHRLKTLRLARDPKYPRKSCVLSNPRPSASFLLMSDGRLAGSRTRRAWTSSGRSCRP